NDGWVLNADDGAGVRTVQFTGAGAVDLTSAGTAIAFITAPTGNGNTSLAVIADNVLPAAGSANSSTQYDTYNGGGARAEDWIGYQFTGANTFGGMVYQDGVHFFNG